MGAASGGVERSRDRASAWPCRGSVSNHLARTGGIRPRAGRRPERCLSLKDREEISRGIAAASRRARSPGRWVVPTRRSRVRSTAAAGGGATAPRRGPRGLAPLASAATDEARTLSELRWVVSERLKDDYSPEQIAGWLRLVYPDNEAMQVSHETIYRALYVQARGTLRRELTRHLRRGRSRRYARSQSSKGQGQGKLTGMVMISERPPEVDSRAVPGHWEGDLLMGGRTSAIATLVERQTRYCQLVACRGNGGRAGLRGACREHHHLARSATAIAHLGPRPRDV